MIKVQQAVHDSPKNTSTYSAQRPEATGCVGIVFYSLTRDLLWTLDTWSAASWPNSDAVNTQSHCPIFSSHEVGLLHRELPISWETWQPPAVTVRWTRTLSGQLWFQRRSLGPAETIKLSASRGRGFPGMLRHCHTDCMQNILVCGSLVRLG